MVNLVFPLSALLVLPILVAGFPTPQGYSVDKEYPDIEPKYQYQYAVTDDYTKSNFQAEEERDGFSTLGSYRVALPDGRIQIVTYSANESGYVAEVTYEGEAVYPEDFEAQEQIGVGGGLYSGSPSVHSNTVYKANRKKAVPKRPSPKKPYKQPPSSRYETSPSQFKQAPNRPIIEPSAYIKKPQKEAPFKADRVQPKPVKIPYNQDPPQFNPVPPPSPYRPIPSTPNLAPYKKDDAQSNPVVRPLVPEKQASQPPAPYDRVQFEEIVKLEPKPAPQPYRPQPPAPQAYRPEPRQPVSLAPEYRIETEGVLLEEATSSVDGEKPTGDILKTQSFDTVVKSEEEEKAMFEKMKEGKTSAEDLQDFEGQVGVEDLQDEVEVKPVDIQLGNAEIVVIDEREKVNHEILDPQRIEESVVEQEPSSDVAEPQEEDVVFENVALKDVVLENDVPFEADDVTEAVKAEEETVEESKTEDALDISKAVVVKTPQTEIEKEE